jgi:protein TonB
MRCFLQSLQEPDNGMHREHRLVAALGTSLALHIAVLATVAGARLTPPVVGQFHNLRVTLAGFTPAPRRTTAPPAAVRHPVEAAAPEPAVPNTGQTGQPHDSPLVEARHDAAGLDNPKPVYPLAARRRGLQGRVVLAAHVDAEGQCREARVRESSGHALLDDAALATVRRWRFLPARRAGRATDSWVEVPIRFRLETGAVTAAN